MAEGFTCEVGEEYRSACEGLDFYGEHEGKSYCVLHFAGEEKKDDFRKVIESKLARQDYDFRGAIFPEGASNFKGREFDADTDFAGATFMGAANFSEAKFSGDETEFSEVQFSGQITDFTNTQFNAKNTFFREAHLSSGRTLFPDAEFNGKDTDFRSAEFSGEWTDFSDATFSSVGATDFSYTKFSATDTKFSRAKFNNSLTFFAGAKFSSESLTSFNQVQFNAKNTSFEDAKFSGGGTYFSGAKFSGEITDFSEVQFNAEVTSFSIELYISGGAQFDAEETSFIDAKFGGKGTYFSSAKFNSARRTSFIDAKFRSEETSFSDAKFNSTETHFREATFMKEVSFAGATFNEKTSFWGSRANLVFGSEAWVRFGSHIGKPELLTFNTVLLHPGWFINTDVRKVDFTDVQWYGMPGGTPGGTLDEEINNLKKRDVESPHSLLAQACRRLSANAEENREYRLANEFHYWSMDALRQESWKRLGLIGTLYWGFSGYGVRAARAFWILVGMWAFFVLLYMVVGPSEAPLELRAFSAPVVRHFLDFGASFLQLTVLIWYVPAAIVLTWYVPAVSPAAQIWQLCMQAAFSASEFWQSIEPAHVVHAFGYSSAYSLAALTRLIPFELEPHEQGLFQVLVTVEGILGPLQIALLALAVRRKVMR